MRTRRFAEVWTAIWLQASFLHFITLFLVSILFGWSEHQDWLEAVLAPFATGVEWILFRTTDYRGQDAIQWPLIVMNSLLCGALIAIPIALWHRRVSSNAGRDDAEDLDRFFRNL